MRYNLNMKSWMLLSWILVYPFLISAQLEADNYIHTFKHIAIEEMHRTGIPASIKLAQGLLESDLGRSPLSVTGNNHFGIKCGNEWQGKEMYRQDDDYGLNNELTKSCFRVFESSEASYVAHSEFLLNPAKNYRYGFLFSIPAQDYVSWAKGLQSAGYATDPAYATKLIKKIEQYNLFLYDGSTEALSQLTIPDVVDKIKDITYSHIVQIGETLQSIASQYQMNPDILIQSNNIQGAVIVGQELNWSTQYSKNGTTFRSNNKLTRHESDTQD